MDHNQHQHHAQNSGSCCAPKHRTDWLLWSMLGITATAYALHLVQPGVLSAEPYLADFAGSVFGLLNKMWWGLLLGIIFVGILAGVPRELVSSVIGKGGTFNGIVRATAGGVLLDLCSHGILLVGMQLYRRGASLGQTMAFLIASPWNSLSLTLILWALIGLQWTLAILFFSLVIALISGAVFDQLVKRGVLPGNPNRPENDTHDGFRKEFLSYWRGIRWTPASAWQTLRSGIGESKMIMRWIFFGIVLASLIRTFVPTELFAHFFGPTVLGLGATLVFATILEVCSEGSMPVAADFLLRAKAPGNTFAFLMTGVSTDYTEMLSLKETTGHWKIAFSLPLVTLPQVILIALLLNGAGG